MFSCFIVKRASVEKIEKIIDILKDISLQRSRSRISAEAKLRTHQQRAYECFRNISTECFHYMFPSAAAPAAAAFLQSTINFRPMGWLFFLFKFNCSPVALRLIANVCAILCSCIVSSLYIQFKTLLVPFFTISG